LLVEYVLFTSFFLIQVTDIYKEVTGHML